MIKVEHLIKKFDNNLVLKDISLEIKKGERVVIIGPSGSGKSTFLRCLNHLEKPTSGKIYFENKLITDDNASQIRKKMSMVFQSFNLFNNLSVLENIVLAPIQAKIMTKEEAIKKAKKLLKDIELEDKIDSKPNSLSGGQQQRVAIIRSLIMEPDIILFDEPTSALDPEMIAGVLELMNKVAESNMTMIIVSHEIDFAKKIATRVLFMEDGKIIVDGSTEEVFNNDKNKRLQEFLKVL